MRQAVLFLLLLGFMSSCTDGNSKESKEALYPKSEIQLTHTQVIVPDSIFVRGRIIYFNNDTVGVYDNVTRNYLIGNFVTGEIFFEGNLYRDFSLEMFNVGGQSPVIVVQNSKSIFWAEEFRIIKLNVNDRKAELIYSIPLNEPDWYIFPTSRPAIDNIKQIVYFPLARYQRVPHNRKFIINLLELDLISLKSRIIEYETNEFFNDLGSDFYVPLVTIWNGHLTILPLLSENLYLYNKDQNELRVTPIGTTFCEISSRIGFKPDDESARMAKYLDQLCRFQLLLSSNEKLYVFYVEKSNEPAPQVIKSRKNRIHLAVFSPDEDTADVVKIFDLKYISELDMFQPQLVANDWLIHLTVDNYELEANSKLIFHFFKITIPDES